MSQMNIRWSRDSPTSDSSWILSSGFIYCPTVVRQLCLSVYLVFFFLCADHKEHYSSVPNARDDRSLLQLPHQ